MMNKIFRSLCGLIWKNVALIIMLMLPAWATSIVALTPEQIRGLSEQIVVATVVGYRSWTGPSGTIRTDVLLADVEVLWSEVPAAPLTYLTYTGGDDGSRHMRVAGMPEFVVGARAVFFLEDDGQTQACPTVGWSQGYFFVEADDALRNVDGWYLGIDNVGHLARAGDAARRIDLATLRARVAGRP